MEIKKFAEAAAARLLVREGISAIWNLHVAAARMHRDGHHSAALSMLQIADAAERQWRAREPGDAPRRSPGTFRE